MEKKKVFLIVLALVVALIAAMIVYVVVDYHTVKPFALQDYAEYVDHFAENEHFRPYMDAYEAEPVEDAQAAKQVAEALFTTIYGESEEPYSVYYDDAEGVWYVRGFKSPFALGGVAEILIRTDGTILAIWHGK